MDAGTREVIRDGTGAIVGLHGVALDITERKQAERVLIQLKAMIDISFDGFWIIDLMVICCRLMSLFRNDRFFDG